MTPEFVANVGVEMVEKNRVREREREREKEKEREREW